MGVALLPGGPRTVFPALLALLLAGVCGFAGGAGTAVEGPAGAAGIVLHWTAADAKTLALDSGGALVRWKTAAKTGRDASQADPSRRPRYRARDAGGRPGIVFDGRDDFLEFPPAPLRDFSAFIVFTPGMARNILLGDAANRNWLRIESRRIKIKWDGAARAIPCGAWGIAAPHILAVVRRGDTVRFFLDGRPSGGCRHGGVFTPEHLGHKFTGGGSENFFCGELHEVLVFAGALSPSARGKLTRRLASEWRLGLGADSRQGPEITHGPMLGAVSDAAAAIWFRTRVPCEVRVRLEPPGGPAALQVVQTKAEHDNTAVVRFRGLRPDTAYTYTVRAGADTRAARFRTCGPSMLRRTVRMEYGYGYNPAQSGLGNDSIFLHMARRNPDFVVFIGDFPYTAVGARAELWEKHKIIRSYPGFFLLTRATPTYAIWDDHDFGPNDCDGTNPNATAALAAFQEYWANPGYGLPGDAGIYSSFVVGPVQVFLLDGRYHARQDPEHPTMLGPEQFRWLCAGLRSSQARYKLLVSGTPFTRVKRDCWGGRFFRKERDRLFRFIAEHRIPGVIGISGDVHRCDIHRIPIGNGMVFYDFTAGALARIHRPPPKPPWPDDLLYSFGRPARNMFGEIDFHPAADEKTAIVFRSFSGKLGMMHRFRVPPEELGLGQ